MKKILSLKIGISHIGWSFVEANDNDPLKIIKAGVHFFKAAENPVTKGSLQQMWGELRRATTTRRRKSKRTEQLKKLLGKSFLREAMSYFTPSTDIWNLRKKGLTEKLTQNELIHVILHLNKHRGYQSNARKLENDVDKSYGKILEALAQNERLMAAHNCETFGEYMSTKYTKRNKPNSYDNIAAREWIENEFNLIIAQQKIFYGDDFFTDLEIEAIRKKIIEQRPLKSCEDSVGHCSFFPSEKNCPRDHPIFSEYSLLTLLNSTEFYEEETNETLTLTPEHLKTLVEIFYDTGKVGMRDIKNTLGLTKNSKLKTRQTLKSTLFSSPKMLELKEILGATWDYFLNIDPRLMEKILIAVSYYFSPEEVKEYLHKNVFREENKIIINIVMSVKNGILFSSTKELYEKIVEQLSTSTQFGGTSRISLEAIMILLPFLKKGLTFQDAVEHAIFQKLIPNQQDSFSLSKLPPFPNTLNPVVNRSLSRARNIINAILNKYGMVDEIHIESGRELGKSVDQRKKILKENKKNEHDKLVAKDILNDLKLREDPATIFMIRLWKQQNLVDFLTGEAISKDDLINQRVVVTPISEKSLNRSFSNMMLVFKDSLKDKHKLIEALVERENEDMPYSYLLRLKSMKLFLSESQGHPTSYVRSNNSWVLKNLYKHISKYLSHVKVISSPVGVITFLRHIWNIDYDNVPNYQRIVLESLIGAATTPQLIHDIEVYLQTHDHPDLTIPFPYRDAEFQDTLNCISPTVMENRSVKGEAHAYTIYRSLDKNRIKDLPYGTRVVYPRKLDRPEGSVETKILKRISLNQITPTNFKLIYNFKKNTDLEAILKERLDNFKWDAEKAFQEPVYIKNLKNPAKTIPINKLYIYDESRSVVAMRGGVTNYSNLCCVNIYLNNHRYCAAPIYTMDILKLKKDTLHARKHKLPLPVFPNTLIERNGEYPLPPTAKFVGRIFKGDYLKIIRKCLIPGCDEAGEKIIEGFYSMYNRSNHGLLLNYWKETIIDSKGKLVSETKLCEEISPFALGKTFELQLFHVDILGNKTRKHMKETPLVR